MHGPNMKKLIVKFIAREAIPPGGGIAAGMEFLTNPERREQVIAKAVVNAAAAVLLIKSAPDNPFGDNEEEIAEFILKRLDCVAKKIAEQKTELGDD